jgi:hypothetical protein
MRGAMGHDGVHALHARQRPDDRQSVERDRPQARMVRSNVMGCGRGSSGPPATGRMLTPGAIRMAFRTMRSAAVTATRPGTLTNHLVDISNR